MRVLGDGGYATKDTLRQLPAPVDVVSRLLITGKLYPRPSPPILPRRGCPPKKGVLLGSPKTWARNRSGWQPHPTEAGARGQAWDGLWHATPLTEIPPCLARQRPGRFADQ